MTCGLLYRKDVVHGSVVTNVNCSLACVSFRTTIFLELAGSVFPESSVECPVNIARLCSFCAVTMPFTHGVVGLSTVGMSFPVRAVLFASEHGCSFQILLTLQLIAWNDGSTKYIANISHFLPI